MGAFDALDLVDGVRAGGASKQARRFHDYAINGAALHAMVRPGDKVGLFGWLSRKAEAEFARWLLLRERSALRSGRVPLYICPECGDLGCGTFSARVIETNVAFVWTEMALELDYEPAPPTAFVDVGPFTFEKRAYKDVVGRFL